MPKFVLLWTDAALFLMLAGVLAYVSARAHAARAARRLGAWRATRPPCARPCMLVAFAAIGLLDSVHYQPRLPPAPGAAASAPPVYAPAVRSALDGLFDGAALTRPEKTYSAPLAVAAVHEGKHARGRPAGA